MSQTIFTSGEVAIELGMPRWKLLYMIERGDLPEPTFAVPGRRLFTPNDLAEMRQVLTSRVRGRGRRAVSDECVATQ